MCKFRGILAGGNFIVDHVKVVDAYPEPEMLASIADQSVSNGGGPYNVLTDLARMHVGVPLEALGLVGDDSNGLWILDDCRGSGIDTTQLRTTPGVATSYTDVMSVASTGQRTFFHRAGANARLGPEHFDFSRTQARLFHLAYLLLLDRLDQVDGDGRSFASRVLEAASERGLITSADLVSVDHPRAVELVASAAPYLDYLLLNEVEAARVLDEPLRDQAGRPRFDALAAAASRLRAMGVRREVVIHFAEGAVCDNSETGSHWHGAVCLPGGFNRGSVGAGDAFAAGYLWAVHEGVGGEERLRWAVCTAAMSLSHPTPSEGMKPLGECIALGEQYGFLDQPMPQHLS
jgi:sugar/nucleoside kinase (ribokinase family)